MSLDLTTLDTSAQVWILSLGRAAWQGGLALAAAWVVCRLLPRLPGTFQCWIWRLAYLRLLTSLLAWTPVSLPLLPAEGALLPVGKLQSVDLKPEAWSLEPGIASWLLLLWLLGAGWRTHRLMADARYTRRLRAGAERVWEEDLLAECRALTRGLRLRPAPVLLASEEVCCPLLTGVARPAVLLPATARERFTRSELRLMLAHELSHLKRRDLLWAWLPNLGRVLFFFHPLVWLAEGEWRLTHEMACDEQAVAATAAAPTHYAAMLLTALARLRKEGTGSFLRAGVVESYGTIRRRLVAVRQSRPIPFRRRALSDAALAAIGIIGVIPWRLTTQGEPGPSPAAEVLYGPTYHMAARASGLSALDEMKIRAWKGQQAASGLLTVPKPLLILTDKIGKKGASSFTDADYLKKLAFLKKQAYLRHTLGRDLKAPWGLRIQNEDKGVIE